MGNGRKQAAYALGRCVFACSVEVQSGKIGGKISALRICAVIGFFLAGSLFADFALAAPSVDQSSPVLTPQNTTRGYNQRLQELAREDAGGGVTQGYRIGAEDLVEISVYGASDLDRTVRVSADGGISLPLIGEVIAAGLTSQALERLIEERLRQNYMNHPQVSVFVREIESHPVSVFGAVGKPGVYQIQGARSLIEVLSMAQGLTDDAGDKVIIMRGSEVQAGAEANSFMVHPEDAAVAVPVPINLQGAAEKKSAESVQIDLKDLLSSANARYNVMVYPGDFVKVPPAGIVYVVGEVRKPGGFLLRTNENISVLQALALAEGTTSTSSQKAARIIRAGRNGAREEIRINLKKILEGKEADPMLFSRDILFIPNSAGKSAFYRGAEAAVSVTTGLIVYRW